MAQGILQIALFCALIVAIVPLLGGHMARVFRGERTFLDPLSGRLERGTYRLLGVGGRGGRWEPDPQDWKAYARSVLLFSAAGWLLLFVILRTQSLHPLNHGDFRSAPWDVTFNTVSSFVTNTNWQFYGGETTMTYVSQAVGLTVQNFVSAAVGLAVAVALIRALAGRRVPTAGDPDAGAAAGTIGNFWQDLTRAITHVLLPIAFVAALVLVTQGVLQTLGATAHGVARGPVASQEAIKELGTNGGGFFNVNAAHPFENPTAFSNLLEMLLILAIPASLTMTYGRMVGSRRQGWAVFGAMSLLFLVSVAVVFAAERHGTPAQTIAGLHGVNLEGKELRNGSTMSALFTAVTTVTSCGAVNSAFESMTGLGGLVPMVNLGYGESVFGGVGTGLYTMLMYVLLAVFIGGLMVGRTPEFLGKKIEAKEIKLVSLGILVTPLLVLLGSGLALATKYGAPSIYATGPQGFSETFYAYLSQANNNGSAFAGYTGFLQPDAGNAGSNGVTFADVIGGLVMLAGRFVPILIVLALAGSLAGKRAAPVGAGTLRTDTGTFAGLLIGVVVLIGALTFFPALLLGPVVQGLTDHLF
ncbi:Potassium-transporting ATPase potassium-binding subunit [Paraconexibacter sp. AEG42_29]|uniref:Potassium-transporting ATPase potassium-binding subunit n=1 Tax=Paraconexibacter sp. AEG42_29 TaxID=2997339 RepID=A0AAU7AQ66_9ACTN